MAFIVKWNSVDTTAKGKKTRTNYVRLNTDRSFGRSNTPNNATLYPSEAAARLDIARFELDQLAGIDVVQFEPEPEPEPAAPLPADEDLFAGGRSYAIGEVGNSIRIPERSGETHA